MTNKPLKIRVPSDAMMMLDGYSSRRQEHFIVITLDGAHQVIRRRVVTKGIANRTLVHPREVFFPAIKDNAIAIIIAHNHPSGNAEPSEEDKAVTRRLVEAGTVLGIPVLDHVVFGRYGYYSFLEHGLI